MARCQPAAAQARCSLTRSAAPRPLFRLREHIAADAAEVASEEDGGINEEDRHWLETGLPIDVTTWGWVHLIIGLLVLLAGFGLFSGQVWARTVGVIIAAFMVGASDDDAPAGDDAGGAQTEGAAAPPSLEVTAVYSFPFRITMDGLFEIAPTPGPPGPTPTFDPNKPQLEP